MRILEEMMEDIMDEMVEELIRKDILEEMADVVEIVMAGMVMEDIITMAEVEAIQRATSCHNYLL